MAGNVAVSAVLLLPGMGRQWALRSLLGLGWVALDLLNFGMGLNPSVRPDCFYPTAPSIEWLQQDKTNFRIMGLGHGSCTRYAGALWDNGHARL